MLLGPKPHSSLGMPQRETSESVAVRWLPPLNQKPTLAMMDIILRANLIMSNNEWDGSGTRSRHFFGYDERLLEKVRELRTARQTSGATDEWIQNVTNVLNMVAGYTKVPDEWPTSDKCREEAAYKARIKQMESERRPKKLKDPIKIHAKFMPKKKGSPLKMVTGKVTLTPKERTQQAVARAAAAGGGKGKGGKRTPLIDKRVLTPTGPPKKGGTEESHRTTHQEVHRDAGQRPYSTR